MRIQGFEAAVGCGELLDRRIVTVITRFQEIYNHGTFIVPPEFEEMGTMKLLALIKNAYEECIADDDMLFSKKLEEMNFIQIPRHEAPLLCITN